MGLSNVWAALRDKKPPFLLIGPRQSALARRGKRVNSSLPQAEQNHSDIIHINNNQRLIEFTGYSIHTKDSVSYYAEL
jgi:hypothetical protein